MKAISAVAVLVLQAGFAASLPPLQAAEDSAALKSHVRAAAQSPFAALENAAKEKAAEAALTRVLNNNLPLTLNAKDVYPTVAALPGGPFSPTPLKLTASELNQPLPPGDYTINTLSFCSEYSVHRPGAGTAYVLGPYEGKAAPAIGELIWRGTEQYHIAPGSLQAVSWAIQSGLTYDQMPKAYQSIVDQVIPDLKSEISGDFISSLENTYNSLAKTANLAPLDSMLAKLGKPGQLALDAERQRQILTARNTSDQIKEQTLFQGQQSGVYTPVRAENGPWTERVRGQVYMKLLVSGGNMATNNVMQIRVMPQPPIIARGVGRGITNGPHLVRAVYGSPQVVSETANSVVSIAAIMKGILGYSQGQGAQALGQVAVAAPDAPVQGPPAPPPPLLAGTVKSARGSYVMRQGTTNWVDLKTGDSIYIGDTIDTGSGAGDETDVVMSDGTRWDLGTETRWVVQDFEYDPNRSFSALTAKYGGLEGTFMYVGGTLVKPSPPNIELLGCGWENTGMCGSIGIRGTEFIWKVNSKAQTMEIDLIKGAVAITPAGSTTAGAAINAPMQIEVTPMGVKTQPLTQDRFDAIKAQSFAAGVPIL